MYENFKLKIHDQVQDISVHRYVNSNAIYDIKKSNNSRYFILVSNLMRKFFIN